MSISICIRHRLQHMIIVTDKNMYGTSSIQNRVKDKFDGWIENILLKPLILNNKGIEIQSNKYRTF